MEKISAHNFLNGISESSQAVIRLAANRVAQIIEPGLRRNLAIDAGNVNGSRASQEIVKSRKSGMFTNSGIGSRLHPCLNLNSHRTRMGNRQSSLRLIRIALLIVVHIVVWPVSRPTENGLTLSMARKSKM
jgi:hypothetical protein